MDGAACTNKCVFDMTGDEILAEHIALSKPARSILIVDKGHGWDVTMFGPESAGLPSECRTIADVVEAIEDKLVNLRRQADFSLLNTASHGSSERSSVCLWDRYPENERDFLVALQACISMINCKCDWSRIDIVADVAPALPSDGGPSNRCLQAHP